jgi:hypothetical protein
MTNKHWTQLTLFECWNLFLDHCPVKLDLTATRNLVTFVRGAVEALLFNDQRAITLPGSQPIALLPEASQEQPKRRPWHSRRERLNRLISTAWEQGHHTYDAIIGFVRQETAYKGRPGFGCSKRAIANWKRAQGLL